MANTEYRRGNFSISSDQSRLQVEVIHEVLRNSYWARNIPLSIVQKSIRHSLCFGVYDGKRQIGFARTITDFATFAYLADVFIIDAYRGKGLSKWLMECVMAHPELQGLRNWFLTTANAHGLYRKFGFQPLADPERFMTIHHANVYDRQEESTG